MRITADRTPILCRCLVTRQWRLFEESVGRLYSFILVFYWKVQRFCWPKGTSLECAQSIYVKITETACVRDELRCLLQNVSLGDLVFTGPYSFLNHANS